MQFLISGHIDQGLDALRDVLAAIGMTLPRTPRRALASLLVHRGLLRLRGLGFRPRDTSEVAPAVLTRIRGMGIERPKIVGNAAEVGEIVARYRDAGVDELIVPGHTFRSSGEREDTLGRFLTEVAAPLR